MTNINKFLKTNDIEKHIVIKLFNRLYYVLESKKDRVLFINLIIKSSSMSLSTKKDNNKLLINFNNLLEKKYVKCKIIKLIFEICPYFAKILSISLNMTTPETMKLLDKNKISNDYIVNLVVTQSKKHPF